MRKKHDCFIIGWSLNIVTLLSTVFWGCFGGGGGGRDLDGNEVAHKLKSIYLVDQLSKLESSAFLRSEI